MSNNNWKVYIHKNKTNGKIYVGVTSQDNPQNRWKQGKGYIYNAHFNNAINKYGWINGFDHIILAQNLSKKDALQMQRDLIELWDLTNSMYGYNLVPGGGMPPVHYGTDNHQFGVRPDFAINASVKARFGKHLSDEHIEKIRRGNMNNRSKSKQVKCIETGIVYVSQNEAARLCGFKQSSLCGAIKKGCRCGGYHWQFV